MTKFELVPGLFDKAPYYMFYVLPISGPRICNSNVRLSSCSSTWISSSSPVSSPTPTFYCIAIPHNTPFPAYAISRCIPLPSFSIFRKQPKLGFPFSIFQAMRQKNTPGRLYRIPGGRGSESPFTSFLRLYTGLQKSGHCHDTPKSSHMSHELCDSILSTYPWQKVYWEG